MKKNYILTLLFSFLFAFSFQAQVTVGTGDVESEEMPIEPWYKFSYSQVIYHAGEINASGTITGLKYYPDADVTLANSDGWDIWIGHTSLNAHGAAFVDTSELTQVFSGTVTVTNQEVSITLDTSFDYNGTDNLMVAVNETSNVNNQYDASSHDFYCTATAGVDRGLVAYSDTGTGSSANPAPFDPATANFGTTTPSTRQSYANITFEGITQSCQNPTEIVIDNIMANTADVSWTSSGSSWEYIVQPAADDAPEDSDSGTVVSSTSVSLSGLTEVTDYIFYVRNNCSGENSGWVAGYFRTGCADLFTLPFEEGFNNGGDPAEYSVAFTIGYTMPLVSTTEECWTVLDESPAEAPSNSSWGMSYWGSGTYEGDQSAALYTDYNQGKNDDYLISPRLDLTGNDRLRFVAKSYGPAQGLNTMEVLMSSTDMDSEDFTIVLSEAYEYPGGDDWTEVFVDLSAYTGAHYIAFHVPPTDEEGFYMFLDEVVIEQTPSCDYPTNVTVSNFTSSSADLSWDAGSSGETEWEYVLQTAGDAAPTGSGTAVSTNSVTLDGLTQGGEYDFYVRASCGAGDFSSYRPVNGLYFMIPPVGGVCSDPLLINALPYNTTDNTSNYQNDYDGVPGDSSSCGVEYSFLQGDDVVYSYTAASDATINVFMTPDAQYAGIFVYDSCDDIGVECVAGAGNTYADPIPDIDFDMNVYAGTTYYFVISTWSSNPTGYDLSITENTCTDPTIDVTVNACDSTTDEYTVDVDITYMGSSSQYTVSDDLGNVQYAQATGVLTFTFSGTDDHVITVEGDDANCNQTYTITGACQYCYPTANCTLGDGVVGLVFADIDNSASGCSTDGYGDFTGMSTDLAQNETYDTTIETGYSSQYVRIWIDLNDNYVFEDDEVILTNHFMASVGTHTVPVTIPSDANLGSHIMRVKTNWSSEVPTDACEETTWAETEDYTVVITEALGINDVELADLRIYPNPVDGNYVTIKSPIGGDKQIELFDINGRRVLSTIISGDMLDISSINTGFYMVEVTINGYKKVSKLIIE